jgi:hypothetical protein
VAAPRVLFVSLTNDVGTDRLVAELGRAGATCAVLAPPGSYASLVRCVSARFALPRRSLRATFALRGTLSEAVRGWRPDRVVPLDDLSATLLRTLATNPRVPDEVRTVLGTSFGAPAGYAAACERVALMREAAARGVRVPAFAAASGPEAAGRIADELGFPLMVKRDQSSGSGGVVRVATPGQLTQALRFAQLKTVAKSTVARLAHLGRPPTPALVQQVVPGRLAMVTAVCRDGQLLDAIGFTALESHPVKRSSTILRPFETDEMTGAARRLVAALQCSGFVSFDFIVDGDGRAFLIEMNPRPIGSAHLGRLFGHDLALAFLRDEAGGGRSPVLPATTAVALFPKELERDPSGRRMRNDPAVLHDVPDDEPEVVAAYLRHLGAEHPAHAAAFTAALRTSVRSDAPAAQPLAA